MKARRRTLARAGLLGAVAFALVLGACNQAEGLFFHPDSRLYATPADDGLAWEKVAFASEDGTRLTGWFIPARGEPVATVIHFHGNAQNMSAHYGFVSWLPARGFNLFLFDYRGYGSSEGTPSLRGALEDSVAALAWVRGRDDIGPRKLIVLGQSLGGAMALAALGETGCDEVVGVAVESAFSSSAAVARDKAPGIGGWLIPDDVRPIDAIGSISPVPVLIMHGNADPVVSYRHAPLLFEAAREPKELWTLDGAGHLAALGAGRRAHLPRLLGRFREWAGAPAAGSP